jgi:hypothetical protein
MSERRQYMNDKTSDLLAEIKDLLKDIRLELSSQTEPSWGLMHEEIMVFLRGINYAMRGIGGLITILLFVIAIKLLFF